MMCNQDMNKFSIPYKYQLRALCEPGSHAGDRPFADLQFVRHMVDTGLSIDCSYGLWMAWVHNGSVQSSDSIYLYLKQEDSLRS